MAGWLGGALLVLAGGTWLVLWLIASRRQLESLDAADNTVLRTIAMNRLLRTVSTVAAGLGVIAGNFAARPDPAQGTASWTNPAGLAGMVVLLVMWGWRPPRLAAAGLGPGNRPEAGIATGPQHPAARLVSSLGALLGLAAAVPLAAGAFLYEALAVASYGFAGFVALMAGLVLLVIAAGEFLLQRNYGSPAAPRSWPRQPVSPALLTTAVLGLLAFLVVLVVTALGQARLAEGPGWVPAGLLTAGVCAVALPALVLARRRQGVADAPAGLDAALRAITVHRVVRTLAATLDRPGRCPAADPEQRLGGGAGPGSLRRDRSGRDHVVAGDRGRRSAGCRGHGHRRHPGARPGPARPGSPAEDGSLRVTAGISVDLASATPPYEQIRTQISSLIVLGALEPGTRLPTVRRLAADLGIAAGTVARAYRELEQSGLIDTRRRNGTVVAGTPAPAMQEPAGPGRRSGAGGRRRGRDRRRRALHCRGPARRFRTTPRCWQSCGRSSASKTDKVRPRLLSRLGR